MDVEAWAALGMAFAFAFTNGFHDAANAIATLVATRAARPGQAVMLASACALLGPLVLGAAVASTVAQIVRVPRTELAPVLGAGLTAAVVWNLFTWARGLPSSSSHALVGGLVGAALAGAGTDAVRWTGRGSLGVVGVFLGLAVSPLLGLAAAAVIELAARRVFARAAAGIGPSVLRAEWATSAFLALSHGANDAQKAVGVISAVLYAGGASRSRVAPGWVVPAAALALALGTSLGGWRIVRTIGRRIVWLRPLDALASQTASAAVIAAASLLGAPVSTSQVVASSVVGAQIGKRRVRRVRWQVVREIGLAWWMTLPVTAALGALALPAWRWFG